jgi:hypothetical protein
MILIAIFDELLTYGADLSTRSSIISPDDVEFQGIYLATFIYININRGDFS